MKTYAVMIQADPDDRQFTESILKEINLDREIVFLVHYPDLQSLIALRGEPVVILINDNNVSPASQILSALKEDPAMSHLPVVILGEMITKELRANYYRKGACSYITKPASILESSKKIEAFFKYWFEVAN